MIRWIFELLGVAGYILLHPFWAWYLNNTDRARILLVSGDSVLLVKPWLGIRHWDFPGGGAHRDEDIREAGAREIREETNIEIDFSKLKLLQTEVLKFGLIRFTAHYYIVRLKDKPTPKAKFPEVIDASWFSLKELDLLSIHDDVRAILVRCLANR